MKRMPWFRLFDEYFTSPSHADLDCHAMWIGAVIMSFIRAACDSIGELQPWAVLPTGKPVSASGIAQKAREPVDLVEASIAKLLDTGTFTRRPDGAIGMPKFPEKQRGESTDRAAKSKALKAERLALEQPTSTVVQLAPVHTALPPGLSVVPALVAGTELANKRAADLAWLVERLTWEPRQPKGLPSLRAYAKGIDGLLAAGMTTIEILAAVDAVAELVEAGELAAQDWTGTKVFSRWLDGMLVKHREWTRKREAKAAATQPIAEPTSPAMDPDLMAAESVAALRKLKGES